MQQLGFTINDSKTSKGNGIYDVEKSSALIIVQWYLKKKGKKVQINGTFDKATLDALAEIKKEKKTFQAVREEMEGFIKNWKPEKPSPGTDRYSPNNGHLETKDMVRVPSVGGGFAIAETNTAVAWAMMVQGAIDYNEKGQYTKLEVSDYGKQLNIGNFLITGSDSGYRNYHKQVDIAMDLKFGMG